MGRSAVEVLDREPTENWHSYPQEFISCRIGGSRAQLLCKYQAGERYTAHGLRGGPEYEARAYQRLLEPLGASAPRFYGAVAQRPRHTWLFVQNLTDSERVDWADVDAALPLAARAIGKLHSRGHGLKRSRRMEWLKRYDASYYSGWAQRAARFSRDRAGRFPWLAQLLRDVRRGLPEILATEPTIIHGELFPSNVLICGKRIYLVDWESAAIGAGEIDLAFLTDGDWEPGLIRQCEEEYQRARWPRRTAPPGFKQRLLGARLYLALRWLGDKPEWTAEQPLSLYRHVRSLARALDI